MALRALDRTVDFIERKMPNALALEKQSDLLRYSLSQVTVDGPYVEFGVFTGGTTRFIAKLIKGRQLHGFDSFEGLPEAWSGFDLGAKAFNRDGRLPRVPTNVILYKGWFESTRFQDGRPITRAVSPSFISTVISTAAPRAFSIFCRIASGQGP